MSEWRGPGAPFELLWAGEVAGDIPLPKGAEDLYGHWSLPVSATRPYVYANFVTSHDGRISFAVPGAVGGGAVSGGNAHDRWLMGLLRARADAVIVGENTLRLEPEHLWTAEFIFPDETAAFQALRAAEQRAATPLQIFATLTGEIATQARVFQEAAGAILIVSTAAGASRARALLGRHERVQYLALGDETVDLPALLQALHRDFAVRTLLCEGGPTLYGAFVTAGLIDDEFLTRSPVLIGNPGIAPARPGLIEGVGFTPASAPRVRLRSVHKAGEFMFLRSSYR